MGMTAKKEWPVKLYCERHPGLAERDTLFIHGNLASSQWWQPALESWKQLGPVGQKEIILADWRGCGKSPMPTTTSCILEDLARDHLQLLKELEKNEIYLVGHSLGGLIALQMMILEPSLVRRAVLLDPVGVQGIVFDDSMYQAFRQMAKDPQLTRTVILGTIHEFPHLKHLSAALVDQIAADAYHAVGGIGSAVLEVLRNINIESAAYRVLVPTLVLHGRQDQVIPLSSSERLADILPDAQLEIIESAGHCWNVEDPLAFTKRIRAHFG
jgi:pimeloyl-ACP methyl ester carboxylesterase